MIGREVTKKQVVKLVVTANFNDKWKICLDLIYRIYTMNLTFLHIVNKNYLCQGLNFGKKFNNFRLLKGTKGT